MALPLFDLPNRKGAALNWRFWLAPQTFGCDLRFLGFAPSARTGASSSARLWFQLHIFFYCLHRAKGGIMGLHIGECRR